MTREIGANCCPCCLKLFRRWAQQARAISGRSQKTRSRAARAKSTSSSPGSPRRAWTRAGGKETANSVFHRLGTCLDLPLAAAWSPSPKPSRRSDPLALAPPLLQRRLGRRRQPTLTARGSPPGSSWTTTTCPDRILRMTTRHCSMTSTSMDVRINPPASENLYMYSLPHTDKTH